MVIRAILFLFVFQISPACQEGAVKTDTLSATAALPPAVQEPKSKPAEASEVMFQSFDYGESWDDISAGLPEDMTVRNILVDNGMMYISSEKGLFHSVPPPAIAHWEREYLLGDGVVGLFPGRAGLYALRYQEGFYQKIPGTDIWKAMHNNLEDKSVYNILETEEGNLLVVCNSGIYKSSDAGQSWKQVHTGEIVSYIRQSGNSLLAVSHEGLMLSTDEGDRWEWVLSKNNSYKTATILDGKLVALVRKSGEGWKVFQFGEKAGNCSADASWAHLEESFDQFEIIYDIEQMGDYLFCSHKGGISRSADRGKTWQLMRASDEDAGSMSFRISGKTIFIYKSPGC